MFREFQGRSKIELMFGILPVWQISSRIQTAAVLANIHAQKTVGSEQLPSRQSFPINERLDTVGPPAHLVVSHKRKDDIGRSGAPFQERGARFRSSEIRVAVIKSRNIRGERVGYLHAVADFVSNKVLGSELWTAVHCFNHG